MERGRRRRGRAARAVGLDGPARPAAAAGARRHRRAGGPAPPRVRRSTSPSSAPGCTPPRRASTRRRSTAPSSATRCWRRAGRATGTGSATRPTTSPTCSSEGANAIGVTLADGWYRGYLGFTGGRHLYGDRTGAFAAAGGRPPRRHAARWSRPTVRGARPWARRPGPTSTRARRSTSGASCPAGRTAGFDDADWTPVELGSLDVATLVAPTGPPVRRTQTRPGPGDHDLAVGQDADRLRPEPGRPDPLLAARRAGRHRDHRPARRGARAR